MVEKVECIKDNAHPQPDTDLLLRKWYASCCDNITSRTDCRCGGVLS
jgi:hypothetical protein